MKNWRVLYVLCELPDDDSSVFDTYGSVECLSQTELFDFFLLFYVNTATQRVD